MHVNDEVGKVDGSIIAGTPDSETKTYFINSSAETVLENFRESNTCSSVSSENTTYDSTEEFKKLCIAERRKIHKEDQVAKSKRLDSFTLSAMEDSDKEQDTNEITRPKSRRKAEDQNAKGEEQRRPSTRGPSTSYSFRPKSVRGEPAPSEEENKSQSKNNSEEDDDDEEDEEYNDKNLARIEGMNNEDANEEDLSLFKSSSESEEDASEAFEPPDFDFEKDDLSLACNDNMSREELENLLELGNIDDEYLTEDYLFPQLELPDLNAFDGNEEMQLAASEKRWHEEILDRKRQQLRYKARLTDYPGVHTQGNGMYNAEEYEGLEATPEIKDLFKYITMYSPPSATTQIEVKLKPFIPEYYPSVGDIDGFIKVIHPEITNDGLGIKVLDEPSAFQSDPSVLDLRLRAMAKQNSARAMVVKKVENVSKGGKIIENWIKDISDLHRSKPSPSVHYSKPMPDIDTLLQEWPQDFEKHLKNIELPPPNLDCDIKTYVDLVCNILDIPVYKSRIQSLHVLATLYSTHKNFGGYGFGKQGGGAGVQRKGTAFAASDSSASRGTLNRQPNVEEPGVDRLEL